MDLVITTAIGAVILIVLWMVSLWISELWDSGDVFFVLLTLLALAALLSTAYATGWLVLYLLN